VPSGAAVPAQTPAAVQASPVVQTLPSLHIVPAATGVFWQPVRMSQLSAVQGLPSSQLRADPGVQVPAMQASIPRVPVHALPSSQTAPSGKGVLAAQPVAGSHAGSIVHGLPSVQVRAMPGAQTPARHMSAPIAPVHALPSQLAGPSATGRLLQPVTTSQLSVVQAFMSLQLSAGWAQTPAMQTSRVQAEPSPVQTVPSGRGVGTQPITGSHTGSAVHGFMSLQTSRAPVEAHTPATQELEVEHASPSSQAIPSAAGR
jgi:hypothetical protein